MAKRNNTFLHRKIDKFTVWGVLLAFFGILAVGLFQPMCGPGLIEYWIFTAFAFAGLTATVLGIYRNIKQSKTISAVVGPFLYLSIITFSIFSFYMGSQYEQQRYWVARTEMRLTHMFHAMNDYLEANGSLPVSIGLLIGKDQIINESRDVLQYHSEITPDEVMVGNFTFQQWLSNDIDISTIDTSSRWEQAGEFLIARQPSVNIFMDPNCVMGLGPEPPFEPGARVVLFAGGVTKLVPDYQNWRQQYNRNLPKYAIPIPDWPNK